LPPYDRAALEAAGLDLALRQRGTNLFRLTETPPGAVRYVVSFGRVADPVAEAQRHGDVELKIDVDPAWDDATLARLSRVAVVDWKMSGTRDEHDRVHRALPEALIEDPSPDAAPWSDAVTRRLSADGTVLSAADVARLSPRPVAVNLKPARMGGVLAALDAADAGRALGIAVYVGGMFEVGCGRTQLRTLAALLSPGGPNDVAPIPTTERPALRPERLPAPADVPGFGDDAP
jgi:L-alanine-DL-glutamate epimerase-like enolase superfamily enzyme